MNELITIGDAKGSFIQAEGNITWKCGSVTRWLRTSEMVIKILSYFKNLLERLLCKAKKVTKHYKAVTAIKTKCMATIVKRFGGGNCCKRPWSGMTLFKGRVQ